MRAAVIRAYGQDPRVEEVPPPTPGPGQVLVRVRAVSVNPVDWKQASGKIRFLYPMRFPGIPGYDIAGDVAEGPEAGLRVHPQVHLDVRP